MADYSYVSVEVEGQGDAFKVILDEIRAEHGQLWSEDWGDDSLYVLVEEQARYGFPEAADLGDNGLRIVIDALTSAGIPWRGVDAGGYEWPETEYRWEPGMDEPKSRVLDGVGNPTLTAHQVAQVIPADMFNAFISDEPVNGGDAVEVLGRIVRHFGDDPAGWL